MVPLTDMFGGRQNFILILILLPTVQICINQYLLPKTTSTSHVQVVPNQTQVTVTGNLFDAGASSLARTKRDTNHDGEVPVPALILVTRIRHCSQLASAVGPGGTFESWTKLQHHAATLVIASARNCPELVPPPNTVVVLNDVGNLLSAVALYGKLLHSLARLRRASRGYHAGRMQLLGCVTCA